MQAGAKCSVPAAHLAVSSASQILCMPARTTTHQPPVVCANRHFHDHFKQQHVDPLLLTSSSGRATATCLCLLTPDGERTMRTHLGASSELVAADQLPTGWTNNCRLLHCEGYCLYKLGLTRGAMQAAKQSGAEVYAMTSSHTCL